MMNWYSVESFSTYLWNHKQGDYESEFLILGLKVGWKKVNAIMREITRFFTSVRKIQRMIDRSKVFINEDSS